MANTANKISLSQYLATSRSIVRRFRILSKDVLKSQAVRVFLKVRMSGLYAVGDQYINLLLYSSHS